MIILAYILENDTAVFYIAKAYEFRCFNWYGLLTAAKKLALQLINQGHHDQCLEDAAVYIVVAYLIGL